MTRALRTGMTLVEMMVVIALVAGLVAVGAPSVAALLDLEQQGAVKELATTLAYLRDEATLRNVTFRVAFDLDRNTWTVQAGSPDATIFSDADERETWERDIQDQLSRYTERELAEGAAEEILDQTGRFADLQDVTLDAKKELPGGTRFLWAYTPQYREPVRGSDVPPEDPAEDAVVYAHIFPDGQMESAVIRLVSVSDEEDGFTLVVEPLTGRIHVLQEEVDPRDLYDWLPETAPELPK